LVAPTLVPGSRRSRLSAATLVALCLALSLTVPACGDDDDGGSASSNAAVAAPKGLLTPGTITFGTDFTFPPYEDIVDGKQQGFDVEFGKLLGDAMGLKVKHVDARFAALIPSLEARKFDAILSAMYVTPERLKQVNFVPYFNTGNVIVVREDGDYQPQVPEDMCGHVFSINEGAFVESVARGPLNKRCEATNKGAIEVKSFPTDTASFQEVSTGRSEVTLGDTAVTAARIKDNPDLGLHVSSEDGKLFYPTPGGMALRKDDADILRALNEAVALLEKNGKLDALREKYALAAPSQKQVDKALEESGA
jgi:polar amino acid transport system substrate-binding protein